MENSPPPSKGNNIENAENEKSTSKLEIFIQANFKLAFIWGWLFSLIKFVFVPLWLSPLVSIEITVWPLVLFTAFSSLMVILWRNLHNRFGLFGAFVYMVAFWFIVRDSILKDSEIAYLQYLDWLGWPIIILVSFQTIMFLIGFPYLSIKKHKQKYTYKENWAQVKQEWQNQKKLISISLIVLVSSSSYLAYQQIPKDETVTIQPLDYQARIAFWGAHYHTFYTPTQLDALNRHSVIIAPYTVSLDGSNASATAFIDEMRWWEANCPNVTFLPAVIGVPGGFVWDGATGTPDLAKYIVNLVHDNNLTNIEGLAFDWENPQEASLGGVNPDPDPVRHEQAVEDWNAFFDWMDINAPEMFLSCVNYIGMGLDTVDEDYDLHYLDRYITYEVPRWDEYAPMIYRCGYKGEKPYGDVPRWPSSLHVDSTYDFYQEMKLHADSVERVHGDLDRLGVYLGITNCTCYGRDVEVWEYGEYQGNGLDMLIRDSLIVKSFGAPIITLFILDTVIENGYSMGGVFDSYGDDFLDVYNASVNGPESLQAFEIHKGTYKLGEHYMINLYGSAYDDLLLNFDRLPLFLLIVMMYVVATLLFFKKNRK